ncbi:MAG: hypothetical protein COB15_05570 [Flavobacteriales bacterium]|nr:MAG: hypothetical protein COB15_05570 [Flavobacteriales bacterium]
MRYLLVFTLIGFKFLCAQTITGKIICNDDKQPASFATVLIEGKGFGTATDENGKFKLTIPKKYAAEKLTISFLGYSKKLILISTLNPTGNTIYISKDAANLAQFTVVSRKDYTPKQMLKKVLKSIEKNYSTDTISFDAYYRETLTESGRHIKYADAVCEFNYAPYQNKKYKRKAYISTWESSNTLSDLPQWPGERLHRYHFWSKTLKKDQLKIIESRSSENLTQRNLTANIEGGPLGLLGKDRVKFRQDFLDKKKFNEFDYTLKEELDTINKEYNYVLYFIPKAAKEIRDTTIKKWRYNKRFRNNTQEGKIVIDRNTFAIKSIEYAISKNLKKHLCTYTTMNIKHFDYRIKENYTLIDGKYYLTSIKQQDEFIYKDTTNNTVTPYNATLEISIHDIKPNTKNSFKKEALFTNSDANQLFDFPLYYNDTFWTKYSQEKPEFNIPTHIRKDMEFKKPLEKQFVDKHRRDTTLKAPMADIIPFRYNLHKEEIIDNYAWMKDVTQPKQNTAVMEYINAENKYFDNYFIPLRKQQRSLFSELKRATEKNYKSLPVKKNGYIYHYKFIGENEYPIYYRKKENSTKEEVLLDVQEMAKDKQYYNAGGITISPNNNIMAYSENTTGNDNYVIKFKNLKTNTLLKDSLTFASNLVWVNDTTIIYASQEKKTNRTNKIATHQLLSNQKNDKVIKYEKDVLFELRVWKSKSKKFIFIQSASSTSSEQYYIRTNATDLTPKLFYFREDKHKYTVTHSKNQFYILTNKKALNNKIVVADTSNYAINKWKTLVPHNKKVLLSSFEIFDKYIVLSEKENAQPRLRVLNLASNKSHNIKFKEDYYSIGLGYNPDFDTDSLQFSYSSYITPGTVYNYHMKTQEKRIVKRRKWRISKYSPYKTKRIWATAKDGKKIPITLFYNKWGAYNKKEPQKNKVLLTSYGSYGAGQGVGFNTSLFPLINRGFIYAVAHIRGGNDLGEKWYLDGKMLNKKNTFTDFIDCAEYLIENDYVTKGNITIQGASAGGLLMGAVANMRPELFKAVILDVPFVDVVNTMLDDKLPLTTGEYEEWGNPNDKKYYNYMKSYSPYENVDQKDYPPMFFFTGINDSRVGYWEPAKMVAKLRKFKTDNNVLLLKTNLNAGHGGDSGRYSYYKALAMKYAIIFDLYRNSPSH